MNPIKLVPRSFPVIFYVLHTTQRGSLLKSCAKQEIHGKITNRPDERRRHDVSPKRNISRGAIIITQA